MSEHQIPSIEEEDEDAAAAREHRLNVETLRWLTARGFHGVWTPRGVTVHPLSLVIDEYIANHPPRSTAPNTQTPQSNNVQPSGNPPHSEPRLAQDGRFPNEDECDPAEKSSSSSGLKEGKSSNNPSSPAEYGSDKAESSSQVNRPQAKMRSLDDKSGIVTRSSRSRNASEPPADQAHDTHTPLRVGLEDIAAASNSDEDEDEDYVDEANPSGSADPASKPTTPQDKTRKTTIPSPKTLREAFIPPGQDQPDYIPFGTPGVASRAQGNYAEIDPVLRGQIVDAEIDNERRRPEAQRLTWGQIMEKYANWGKAQATLRWYNIRYTGGQYRTASNK